MRIAGAQAVPANAPAQNDDEVVEAVQAGGAPSRDDLMASLDDQAAVIRDGTDDAAALLNAVTRVRQVLSLERDPPISQVIDQGIVPHLVELLSRDAEPRLQFEAAWALTNIASGTSEHTRHVVEHGAVPRFVALVGAPSNDVVEQAMWALGNIAGDSAALRDVCLGAGAMHAIVAALGRLEGSPVLTTVRNAVWTISNLCRGKPQSPLEAVAPALPVLARLLHSPDDEVLTDATWAISYICDGDNSRIQAVVDAGVVRRLVELLGSPEARVATPALRSVGNIVTGDDMQTQLMLNAGCLPALGGLLSHRKKSIRKEAVWAISNITAGSADQIQAVINAGLLAPLVAILGDESGEFDVRKEAAWALSNATSGGTTEQVRAVVDAGVLPALVAILEAADSKIITVALEGLVNILRVGMRDAEANDGTNPYCDLIEECGGLDKLEALQSHPEESVYHAALRILEEFFMVEEEEEGEGGGEGAGGEGVGGLRLGGFDAFGVAPPQPPVAAGGAFNIGFVAPPPAPAAAARVAVAGGGGEEEEEVLAAGVEAMNVEDEDGDGDDE